MCMHRHIHKYNYQKDCINKLHFVHIMEYYAVNKKMRQLKIYSYGLITSTYYEKLKCRKEQDSVHIVCYHL